MTGFKLSMLAGVAVAAVSLASGAAQATVITQSISVGNGAANPTSTTELVNAAFNDSIKLFDAAAIQAANSGYNLAFNSVTLTFNSGVKTGGTVKNTASQAQSFSFDLQLDSYLNGGAVTGNGAAAQNIATSNFGSGSAGDITVDFGRARYTNLGSQQSAAYPVNGTTTLNNGAPTYTFTDAASLAAFTGTGTFSLLMNTGTSQIFTGGGGNTSASLTTTAGAEFTVAYDYTLTQIVTPPTTNVPEPASLMLLGAGLLGIGMIRRKSV